MRRTARARTAGGGKQCNYEPLRATAEAGVHSLPVHKSIKIRRKRVSYKTWMGDNTALHTKKLRYICLPVTHDSGTCELGKQLTPDQGCLPHFIDDTLAW